MRLMCFKNINHNDLNDAHTNTVNGCESNHEWRHVCREQRHEGNEIDPCVIHNAVRVHNELRAGDE